MARLFDDAANQYLIRTPPVVLAAPITVDCWVWVDDVTINQAAIGISSEDDNDFNGFWLMVRGAEANDLVQARLYDGGDVEFAVTTTGVTVNTWHHICAVYESNTSRSAYIDGGSKGTDAGAETPAGVDNLTIGAIYYWNGGANVVDAPFSGRICEVGVWEAALNDDEVAFRARGNPATSVRPRSLVAYYPLVGPIMTGDNDFGLQHLHISEVNSPTWANHAPNVRNGLTLPYWQLDGLEWNAFWGEVAVARIPRPPAAYNTLAIY